MKSKDKVIFKQAFDELSQEGYFEDFIERVNRLQPTPGIKSKSVPAATRPPVYYDKRASGKK